MMQRLIALFGICAGTILFATGCGKTDNPSPPKEAQQAPSAQGSTPAPSLPTPPLPDPVVPKGAGAPSPTPGQAGDHSSPAFKEGGKANPPK